MWFTPNVQIAAMCGPPCLCKGMAQIKVYTVCLSPQSLQEFTLPHWDQSRTPLGELTAVQHLGGQSHSGNGKTEDSILGEIPRAQERLQCVPRSSTHDWLITAPFGCQGSDQQECPPLLLAASRQSFPPPAPLLSLPGRAVVPSEGEDEDLSKHAVLPGNHYPQPAVETSKYG